MTSLIKSASEIGNGITRRTRESLDERVRAIIWPRTHREMDPLVMVLIRRRLELRLSRRLLAERIIERCGPATRGRNLTARGIIAYERGEHVPGIDRARRWARALDIEIISVQHVTR